MTEIELLDEKQVDAKVFKNEFKEKILVNILEIAKMLQNVEKLIAEKNFHEASRILVDVKSEFVIIILAIVQYIFMTENSSFFYFLHLEHPSLVRCSSCPPSRPSSGQEAQPLSRGRSTDSQNPVWYIFWGR